MELNFLTWQFTHFLLTHNPKISHPYIKTLELSSIEVNNLYETTKMASYAKFVQKIGKGNIESAYTNVLTDVNYCIHLFEDLEIGRTTTESWFDSYAGERKEVDLEHLSSNLKILKKEIEIGLQLYMKLSCKMNILNATQSSQESKLRSIMHSDQTTPRWGIEQELRSQFEELLSTVSGIKIQENRQFKNDWFSYIPGVTGYRDRTTHYSEARILYQALNQDKILNVLKENHASINGLIWCIDDAIRNVNNPKHHNPSDISAEYHETSQQENSSENTEFDTVLDSEHDNHIDNTEPDNSSSPKGTEVIVEQLCVTQQADCTQSSAPDIDENDLARAKDEYNAVLIAELDELDSTEKGLSEETRIGMATREAVRSCKRFLKEELKLSNSIADEYIKTIQASSL